jgi:uncharacterized protein (TIGR00251 family)
MNIRETEDGAIIEIFVKPSFKRFEITLDDEEIVVFCVEQPVKGKVNKELVKEFSKFFHAKVELVSGFSSKQKRLLIKGFAKSEVEQLLSIK